MSLFDSLHPDWQIQLADMEDRICSIAEQISSEKYLPAKHQIFRALSQPIAHTKVLIVGQDPYPNPDYPCGLAFSINPEVTKIPGSLNNILKEVGNDIGSTQIVGGDLTPWHEQGVMLLNRILTVRPGESGSHSSLGWQAISERVAEVLNERSVIPILWGKFAQELTPKFTHGSIISGVHPSPLSAHRGFFGSKPFSSANRALREMGLPEINW